MTTIRKPPPAFPLHVVTGFLGAGKTTLLNRVLRDELLRNALVIVNEFGEIGLDQLLVRPSPGEAILLPSGCVCCAMRDEFVNTLENLLRRHDNGRLSFDRVIVETTGVADPSSIARTLLSHPYLAMRFRLASVVALVDAVNGLSTLEAHEEAIRQAAMADLIVLTKTDLLERPDECVRELKARLAAVNPVAPIVNAAASDAAALLRSPSFPSGTARNLFKALAVHDSGGGRRPLRSFTLTRAEAMSPELFERFMAFLSSVNGPDLLRVKGLVQLSDDPDRPAILHVVQRILHPIERLPAWPDKDRRTRVVFIGFGLQLDAIETILRAFSDRPQTDTPDAAALLDNPLAPSVGGFFT